MMCACDWNFVCTRCRGTRHDPAYMDGDDERTLERERADRAHERLLMETIGRTQT